MDHHAEQFVQQPMVKRTAARHVAHRELDMGDAVQIDHEVRLDPSEARRAPARYAKCTSLSVALLDQIGRNRTGGAPKMVGTQRLRQRQRGKAVA